MNNRNIAIISLILIGIATRFFAPWPNFTAVGAVALFGGAMFKDSYKAFLIPLVTLFVSDLIINNVIYAAYYEGFQWFTMGAPFIYLGFILTVIIGRMGIKEFKILPIAGGAIASTLVFFLLTNFGAWTNSPALYPRTFAGVLEAYAAGLPFILSQLVSTVAYGAILFLAAKFWLGSKESLRLVRA